MRELEDNYILYWTKLIFKLVLALVILTTLNGGGWVNIEVNGDVNIESKLIRQ